MKKTRCVWIIICLVLFCTSAGAGRLSPELSEKLRVAGSDTILPVIIRMKERTHLRVKTQGIPAKNRRSRLKLVIRALRQTGIEKQGAIIEVIKRERNLGGVEGYTPFWIFNGLSVKATPAVIKKLALRDDVEEVMEDFPLPLPFLVNGMPRETDVDCTWNIEMIRAPEVWSMGYRGEGVVVGIIDTGVDVTHPDLAGNFRGGNNSWFDPHYEHPCPVDAAGPATGHGTHIAGIILGGDNSGMHIGVAPAARWIAARIWNDAGDTALSSDVHKIFQWFLDPDGDPETDDAPDILNGSWGFKLFDAFPWCRTELQDDVRALREAGVIPVFAAGNSGPLFFSGESPANYPETIAVGATSVLDSVTLFSSRGPGNCDRSIFPDLAAPGRDIFSSAPGGEYWVISGTSQAAPHVTGTIALMLSANSHLTVEEIELAIKRNAHPLGLLHPNFSSGWGRVDALRAVFSVLP